jgi:dipeptidase
MDVPAAIRLLQDHGTTPYRPDSHWLGDRICAHAANGLTRNATQTTGSLVAQLQPGRSTLWVTGTAAPCTAIFKPVWFDGAVLPDIGPPPGERFDPASLWWFHEQYHRRLLFDFDAGSEAGRQGRMDLQNQLFQAAVGASDGATAAVTAEAFRRSRAWTEQQITRLCAGTTARGGEVRRTYRRYWEKLNRQAGMPAPGAAPVPAAA